MNTRQSERMLCSCGVLGILLFFCLLAGWKGSLDASGTPDEIAPYECQVEARQGENYDYAAAQLWVPPHSCAVCGVLCLILHPLDQGGSRLRYPKPWIDLTQRENCALMAISFAQSDDLTRDWCHADQGTGRALFAALGSLAGRSGVSNLSKVPIVVGGVCAAGQFAYHLAAFAPNRIAAFVSIGGGKHDLSKVESAAKVSALIVVTPDRGAEAVKNLDALYLDGQKRSAPWLCEFENIANYDAGFCSASVFYYLQRALASLGTQNRILTTDENPPKNPPIYLPISICGERLSPLGSLPSSQIALGTIDSLLSEPATCSFDVEGNPDYLADAIFIPIRDSAISTDIQRIKPGCWHVTCRLDRKKLSLGPLHIDVPIRYLRNGNVVLGGTTLCLTGFVTGEIECVPRNLNLGMLEAENTLETKIRLISKNQMPIKIGTITSTYPWIKAVFHPSADGSTELCCSVNPPPEVRSKGFSGYLHIQIESPTHQLLQVFYYGSVN